MTNPTFREQWGTVSAFLDFYDAELPDGDHAVSFDALAALAHEAQKEDWKGGLDALLDKRTGEVSARLEQIALATATYIEAKKQRDRDGFSERDVQVMLAVIFRMLGVSIAADSRTRRVGADKTNAKKAQKKTQDEQEYIKIRKTSRNREEALWTMVSRHQGKNPDPAKGYAISTLQNTIKSDTELRRLKKL